MFKSGGPASNGLGRIKSFIRDIEPVRFFILISATFGLTFLFITPPFETPDEPAHFMRAYQISEGNFVPDQIGLTVGGLLPSSINNTVLLTTTNPNLMFHPENKYSLSKTHRALSIKLNARQRTLYDFGATAAYSPVSYVPQTIMILPGRLLNLSPVLLMYLGRLGSLATWIILFAWSIRLMPSRKWLMVFIGLLPMALFEGVSLSTDVMAVGLLALFLSLILKAMDRGRVLESKDMLLLLVVGTMMALSKQEMFIFVPLILLISGKLLANTPRKKLLNLTLLLGVPLILFGLWVSIVRNLSIIGGAVNGQNPHMQIGYIHHHALSYVFVLARTYVLPYSDTAVSSFVGNFGWLDTPLPEFIVAIGYIFMFIIFATSYEKRNEALVRMQKTLIFAIGVLYWLAATTALYLYFTPVGAKTVWGMVGRYFLPIALLLIPLCNNGLLQISKSKYLRIAKIAPIFLLSYSVLIIVIRYYVYSS